MSEYPEPVKPYDPKAHDSFYAGYGPVTPPPGRRRVGPWTALAVIGGASLLAWFIVTVANRDTTEPESEVVASELANTTPNIGDAALGHLADRMDADNVPYTSEKDLLRYAQQVCTDWDREAGFDYVLLGQLKNFNFSPGTSERFVAAATSTYCPEHLNALPN